MEIITNNPIAAIIIALISILGLGFAIRIISNKNNNRVKQKENKVKGNISGRDTIINSDVRGKQ